MIVRTTTDTGTPPRVSMNRSRADSEFQASELLAAAAHELRRPLSHIKAFITTLRREDVKLDENTRIALLADIELETDRLAQLIDSLLMTRMPTGRPATGAMALASVGAVVERGLHRVRRLVQHTNRPIVVDVPASLPSIRIDAGAIERVLANLVENAIKYSPPETPINISAEVADEAELVLSVEDRGPGVPPDDREDIFEPFVRKQTIDTSQVQGHGLGLAICRSIVLAHGGRMQVNDRTGGGARFSVFLPLQRELRVTSGDMRSEPAEDSHRGRRGADAPAHREQSEGQRLPRPDGSGRQRSVAVDRRTPFRPAAA